MTARIRKNLFLSFIFIFGIFGFSTAKCAPNDDVTYAFVNATNPHIDLYLTAGVGRCENSNPTFSFPDFINLPFTLQLANKPYTPGRSCDPKYEDPAYFLTRLMISTDGGATNLFGLITLQNERVTQIIPYPGTIYRIIQSGNTFILTNYPSLSKK